MVILCFSITVGYATYNKSLGLIGKLTIKPIGKVEIVRVELDSSAGYGSADGMLGSNVLGLNSEGNLAINYSIKHNRSERTEEGTFLIYLENNSVYNYTFTGITMNPEVSISSGNNEDGVAEVTYYHNTNHKSNNISNGTNLAPGEAGVIAIVLNIYTGSEKNVNIGVSGSTNINSSLDNSGELIANLKTSELDLSGDKEYACFDFEVLNTYKYARNFQLSASGNFSLVDENGNPLPDFHIGAPSEVDSKSNIGNYKACLKVQEGSIFANNTTTTTISLTTNEVVPIILGDINVTVDINNVEDNNKVEIANVSLSLGKYDIATGTLPVYISWNRTDTGGSELKGYYFQWYDATTNTLLGTYDAGNTLTSFSTVFSSSDLEFYYNDMVTNNHLYYVKVYGEDAQNSGLEDCSSSEQNNYCVASPSISFKWEFNVDTSELTNSSLSSDSPTRAYLNNTYSATITPASNYNLPTTDALKVYMNGEELFLNTDYTYDSSSGAGGINITKSVTGDITISGEAKKKGISCLAEGTKIKLANGKYKNIEDIRYDDLIMAYSYDLGKVVFEYPIWIEKENMADSYQKITFSDGTILKTVGEHGIYSVDAKKYVSATDKDNFKIGTRVIKFDKNNKKKVVQVENIEIINEKINYYHVTSNRYHNVLSNDILTTDAFLVVSNMFAFDNNIMWTSERDEFLKTNDLFYYEDWSHMFARHLFAGYRMPETKHLFNQGLLDINYGSWILDRLALTPDKSSSNKNMWMVTSSDDLKFGRKGVKLEEESIYVLPEPVQKPGATFKGWYNTADNKYYMPGDNISVDYGMYFEAVWK